MGLCCSISSRAEFIMPLTRFLTTVKVRAGPSTSTSEVAKYCNGDTVNYDNTVEN